MIFTVAEHFSVATEDTSVPVLVASASPYHDITLLNCDHFTVRRSYASMVWES